MMLRLLRLIKLTRFLKLFKTLGKELHTMKLILKSVRASQRTLFWSMLLLFMMQYVIGMIVFQLTQGFIQDEKNDIDQRRLIFNYYGTFMKTQITMFEITHVNYSRAVRILADYCSEWWAWFFIVYRCCVAFAFVSVIKAVFIQSTLKVAERDRELLLHNKRQAKKELHQKLVDVFHILFGGELDQETFTIDRNTFLNICKQEPTKVWMSALDIDISHPQGLFSLMDLDGDGNISIDEFINVANRVRGPAQTIDLYYLQDHMERLESRFDELWPANQMRASSSM